MTAYLIERRQKVKLDGVHSTWRTIKTGVPQRYLLGSLLFNMYVNDLNYFITGTSLRLYARPTSRVIATKFEDEIIRLKELFAGMDITVEKLIRRPLFL